MRRPSLTAMIAVALMMLALPQSASADKPRSTCPRGSDLGALTFVETLGLENVQRAFDDGVYDAEALAAEFESLDGNDDGVVCLKSFPSNANEASLLQYFYNGVDNNASVPSG